MKPLGALLAAVLAAASVGAVAQSNDPAYEESPRISTQRLLPPVLLSSGNHRVRDETKLSGNWMEFEIESDFGTYRALSIPMVAVRVHEIRTLAQAVDEFRRSNQKLVDTLRGQLTVGADSFVDILTSPVSTTSQIVGQFRNNVRQTIDELREVPPEDGRQGQQGQTIYHSIEPGDPVVAAHKRNVASQLNLDVYSSNPRVQEFLDTLAAARGAGQQSAGIVTVTLPRSHEVSVSGGKLESAVRTALTHNTINQLYARNLQRLEMAGIDRELSHAFLSHPVLSPWHKTMLTEQVVFLGEVKNREAMLRAATTARSEEDALAFVQVAKMLTHYKEHTNALRALISGGHIVLATTGDDALLAVLPFDVVYWGRDTQRVFSGLAEFALERGFKRHGIVAAGLITDAARRGLETLGFELQDLYLLQR